MTTNPTSQLPPARMAGPDWAQITRQLRQAEVGAPGTDVMLRPGGQPELIDPYGQATQLSRLPAERMAAGPTAHSDTVPTVRLTDGALAAIAASLTTVAPERGGALLGIEGMTHLLLSDTQGSYSPVSWDISEELTTAIGALESAGHGILTGTVHSHPRGIPDPSSTDLRTTALALQMNPHLDRLLIAVVTEGVAREFDVAIGSSHRMSVHVLAKSSGPTAPTCSRACIEIVSLRADLAAAGLELCSLTIVDDWVDVVANTARTPNDVALAHTVRVGGNHRLIVPLPADQTQALIFDGRYPLVGPMALQVDDDEVRTSDIAWDPAASAARQLAQLVGTRPSATAEGFTDRVRELVGSLAAKSVLIAGLGSVGSRIADDLVRAGVAAVTVVDPDIVTAPNLARSVYRAADLGASKTAAITRHLGAINPAVRVAARPVGISDLDLPAELDGVDLVIAATDDMAQQALLAHHAYESDIPLVACALYRKAAAGEVVLQVPQANTACWSCAVGVGSAAASRRPETDYGTGGRLVGESALGPPITIVTSVAAQIALGLLAGPESPAGQPLHALLTEGRTLGIIATTPGWDFFPTLFAGMAHQHSPQSVWPVVPTTPGCPVCGEHRQAPMTAEQGAAIVDDLYRLTTEGTRPTPVRGPSRQPAIHAAATTPASSRRGKRRHALLALLCTMIAAASCTVAAHLLPQSSRTAAFDAAAHIVGRRP
ncbi:ThiF family adenylyltransferase [Nocardia sp. NPDC050412]|uniref:ThiF family adenylyltransferase n=1 Tax=Nocardia sp. NPDC050412 TaxID=3364320 RepID=UPI00378FFC71